MQEGSVRRPGVPRRWTRQTFGASLVVGLAMIAPVVVPGAAEARPTGLYRLQSGQRATVRTNPNGFAIGTIAGSDTFYLLQSGSKGSAYGKANGSADLCGWVEEGHLEASSLPGNHPRPACPPAFNGTGAASRDFLLAHYASEVNDVGAGSARANFGCPIRLAGDRALWGNVSGGSTAGPQLAPSAGAKVSWRYRAKSNPGIAMVDANGVWGFIRVNPNQALPHTNSAGHCPSSNAWPPIGV